MACHAPAGLATAAAADSFFVAVPKQLAAHDVAAAAHVAAQLVLCSCPVPHRTEIPGPCQAGSHQFLNLQNLASEHIPAVTTLSDHHFRLSAPGKSKSRTVFEEIYVGTFLSFYFRKKSDGHGHGPSKLSEQAK